MNIPIFLSSDNNYAPFVATTIASICDNTKSFVEVYVLDGGITEENQEKISALKDVFKNFSIEFIKIDLEKEFSRIKCSDYLKYISLATYNRFLIPDLKPEIDRALYSDVDVIFTGDIKEMYEEDLDGYIIGAVWESYHEPHINIKRKIPINLSEEHKYFSAGNLLIDCKKWRENDITNKLFEIVYKYQGRLRYNDMDVLNICFENNYKVLPLKYCYVNQAYENNNSFADMVIRHFNGSIKPWNIDKKVTNTFSFVFKKDLFWHYAQLTQFYDEILKKVEYKSNLDFRKYIVIQLLKKRSKASAINKNK